MYSVTECVVKRPSSFYRLSVVLTGLGLLAALVLAVLIREQYRHEPLARNEVARLESPDGKATALLYEAEGKGSASFLYDVLLRSGGQTELVAHLAGAMRNDRAYGVDLRWSGNSELDLVYLQAQSAQVLVNHVSAGTGKVNVVLKPGVQDETAPPGSMLFHLQELREPGM
ncbi:hypothetical protein [Silvibacterium dinghuense]|uniref:Uncharacterized protein n=1 Tax=Silvibacterium dinghuense TaxID=1560006 RepID=A0A4V1NVD5_9BACT|nr:hypothetical protein [Silvibacterium dinghuense]RXS95390.1 hypothetical protein ESZ00_12480 [Silvibacterium dinghuense]GGH12868.1 hypothetical protein GCM10011586_32400 [Silvibacterium dinghuense]